MGEPSLPIPLEETDIPPSSETLLESDFQNLQYESYTQAFEQFTSSFFSLYASPHVVPENGFKIYAETVFVPNLSNNGGSLTRYTDADGSPLLYRLLTYGESGRVETNYCLLDNIICIQKLFIKYNGIIYMEDPVDPLYYQLEEFVLDDGLLYQLDHVSQSVVPVGTLSGLPFLSIEELEFYFLEESPSQ